MTARRTLAVTALMTMLAGCGYEGSNDVRRLPSDQLFGLDQTTTTSTSSTTSTTIVAPPVDSVPTTEQETTTTAVATGPVTLFFLDGEQLTSVSQSLSSPVSLKRVLDALEMGPLGGDAVIGLSSAVPADLVDTAIERSGVAEVDLVAEVYEDIPTSDEEPATAQIVLTLTRQPGIGQVVFTLDGEPTTVRLGNGLISTPGQPVSADDYATLLGAEVAMSVPATDVTTPVTEPTDPTIATDPTDPTTPTTPAAAPTAASDGVGQ